MLKKFIFLACLFTAHLSMAGDKVGNGGGLWTCSSNKSIQNGFLVDLYEAQEEFGLTLIGTNQIDPMFIVQERSEFVRLNMSEYSATWNKYLSESFGKIRMLDSELVIVDDSLFRIKPAPSTCDEGWIYTQFANFTNQDQILIRSDLWSNKNIAPIHKAALIWHEVIYKWLRDNYQDKDSVRARQIVGYLFSSLPAEQIKFQIARLINTTPPPPPAPTPTPTPIEKPPVTNEWICMVSNSHISTYYSDYGINQLEAKSKTLQKCQNSQNGFFCDENSIKCENINHSQLTNTCQVKNSHINQTYFGNGRSLLEAEFKAREACQSTESKFFCDSNVTCQ